MESFQLKLNNQKPIFHFTKNGEPVNVLTLDDKTLKTIEAKLTSDIKNIEQDINVDLSNDKIDFGNYQKQPVRKVIPTTEDK